MTQPTLQECLNDLNEGITNMENALATGMIRPMMAQDFNRWLARDRAVIAMLEAGKQCAEACRQTAKTHHRIYDGNAPYLSEHDSGYKMGVADGHRLAASWCEPALTQAIATGLIKGDA